MAHLTSASSEGAEGHDVEERDHQVPEHRGGRQEDPEDDHHEVPGETRCQFDRQQLDVAIRDVLAHQSLRDGVSPDHGDHHAHEEQADAVHRHRALGLGLVDVFREQAGGERQERRHQQEKQVQPREDRGGAGEAVRDHRVGQPGRSGGTPGYVMWRIQITYSDSEGQTTQTPFP